MSFNRVLVVSDNAYLVENFKRIIYELQLSTTSFKFCRTSAEKEPIDGSSERINVKRDFQNIKENFDLIISLHCKQIFPHDLVRSIKCINIHPGLNPYNRGWYPQVFSIINKLPIGATIHEMDELIDHGKIIDQIRVDIQPWETSLEVYNNILTAELKLIRNNLLNIISDNYITFPPGGEGNYNSKEDFKSLLEIDLNESTVVSDFIDKLRGLTHGDFKNAFFRNSDTGKKIYVSIKLIPE
jgi:methionyl-tRNA formyltransferase